MVPVVLRLRCPTIAVNNHQICSPCTPELFAPPCSSRSLPHFSPYSVVPHRRGISFCRDFRNTNRSHVLLLRRGCSTPIQKGGQCLPKMKTDGDVSNEASALNSEDFSDDEDVDPLRCWDCNINFTSKNYLYDHLFHHIKQPQVSLARIQLPPLKIIIKNKTGSSFEIVNSPSSENSSSSESDSAINLAENEEEKADGHEEEVDLPEEQEQEQDLDHEDETNVNFSPNFAEVNVAETSPVNSDSSNSGAKIDEVGDGSECGSIPGAEPTPPPEPSPDYPKIRIKTTGLLKEPLTITEITDDNPDGDNNKGKKNSWSSMEDPLKLPGNEDIFSIFNNNERAKDLGFTTSDSEFIPLDRLGDRNSNALQLYNQSQMNQNTLNSLAGLPMEALAQQVSRLQPSSNGMHQQNVLINIQQFPQAPPPPPPYHPPSMYHHPPQAMYPQPYPSYQPPNPMYYPPATGYPQHMPPPPPQPQMPQLGQPLMGQPPMGQPPSSQAQSMQQNQQYRPLAPRQPPPRQMQPQRMPVAPRQPMGNQRQPMPRQRAPMVRPRGGGMTAVRSVRPRMPLAPNGQIRQPGVKRSPDQIQALQAKKKRLDVLTPDKDDEDCQVICMQPKNMDGGLPQISSVQGGTAEPSESSVMHLSDSITLSVRNPQPRPQSPKKSDAKAVANILATRGITVTATPKPKDKNDGQKNQAIPAQLNLNAAVSIIPSAKNSNKPTNSSGQESHLPTVDLTDDTSPVSQQMKAANNSQKPSQRQGLPFKCDLCPAQYPNAMGLSKHRQNYHKTNSGMCEIGVPLINLKQPGIFQKLSSMGIFNYIPLPTSGPDGMFALPIINGRNPGNVAALGATTMLTLGPVRNIPRPQNVMNGGTQGANKQIVNHNK